MSRQYMSIEEFRSVGFLQEANRLFFHPRGLALEVVIDDDGCAHLSGIWDSREDPEGIVFADALDLGQVGLSNLNVCGTTTRGADCSAALRSKEASPRAIA